MKKLAQFAVASSAALALAACGSADDASVEAEADTVEMPADEAMADVAEEPVMDEEGASMEAAPEPDPVTEEEANSAADSAEDVIAAAEAAADTAGDAVDAAEAMVDAVE